MGDSQAPPRHARHLLAALPFAVALAVSAAALNGPLASNKGAGKVRLEQAPSPPVAPAHHEETVYESTEPVNV